MCARFSWNSGEDTSTWLSMTDMAASMPRPRDVSPARLLHVSEGAQALELVRAERAGELGVGLEAHRLRLLAPRLQLLLETLHDVGMLRGHVLLVERVVAPVEQLELGRSRGALAMVDELPPVQRDREGLVQLVFVGRETSRGLGDRGTRPGGVALPLEERHQARPLDAFRGRRAAQLEERRHDVHLLDHVRDPLARGHAAGPPEEQRHVRELAVRALLVERLAV